MADRKEQIILEFEIDRGEAVKDLDRVEKALLNAKKQQQELNKSFKEGKITEDQYIKSNRELQDVIKRETEQKKILNQVLDVESNSRNAMRQRVSLLTKEYNNLNLSTTAGIKRSKELEKELSSLNAELNKGSKAAGNFKDNIGNYPEQFGAAIDSVKPFGASISDAGSSLAKFANPLTAAVSGLAALTSAYASSSTGAKDLAFSQDLLSSATSSLIEEFGTLIGGTGEGGEGIFSKFVGALLFQVSPSLATTAITASQAREALRELAIEATRAQGFGKFFEKAAEDARRLRDEEEALLEDRLRASNAVEQNLQANQTVRVNIINQEIEAIKTANINWKNQNDILLQIEQKRAEVRDIEEEINGKLTENFTARKNILTQINDLERATRRAANPLDVTTADPLQGAFDVRATLFDSEIQLQENFNDRIAKMQKESANEAIRQKRREAEARIALEQHVADATIDITNGFLGVAASLFDQQSEEYKTFATAQTLISTYAAAQKAYEAAFVPPTVASPGLGVAYAALAVVQGLARVAQINGVQFAEGGWTGPGSKMQVAGVVHADEYVVPKRVKNNPMAQPHITALDNMRLRPYADGGLVASVSTAPINQSMDVMNLIKSMPSPIVSVKEINREQKRVRVKESLSKR